MTLKFCFMRHHCFYFSLFLICSLKAHLFKTFVQVFIQMHWYPVDMISPRGFWPYPRSDQVMLTAKFVIGKSGNFSRWGLIGAIGSQRKANEKCILLPASHCRLAVPWCAHHVALPSHRCGLRPLKVSIGLLKGLVTVTDCHNSVYLHCSFHVTKQEVRTVLPDVSPDLSAPVIHEEHRTPLLINL